MSDAMRSMQGKVALVTGGAAGLGRAIAESLARAGARVLITDIDQETGNSTAAALGVGFIAQDVTEEARWAEVMDETRARHGRLDVLVNNAGYAPMSGGLTPEDIDLAQAQRIFRVNFDGTLLGCKYAIAAMKTTGGSIVNISSVAALQAVPFITAYGAAKAAVLHLTRSVALYCAQQGYRIRCNSVHPGQIRTAMHTDLLRSMARQQGQSFEQAEAQFRALIPTGDYGRPEDVASAVLYLASEASAHVTGDRIVVDGGMTLVS